MPDKENTTPEGFGGLNCDLAKGMVLESKTGMGTMDRNSHFVWMNPSYCRMLGIPSCDLITGTHFSEWTHPDHIAIEKDLLQKIASGEISSFISNKAYKQFGCPPGKPRYTWGIFIANGVWDQSTSQFLGYRIQFMQLNNIPEAADLAKIKSAIWKTFQWAFINWRTIITVIAIAVSLISTGSDRLLNVLEKAHRTAESVDSALGPSTPQP